MYSIDSRCFRSSILYSDSLFLLLAGVQTRTSLISRKKALSPFVDLLMDARPESSDDFDCSVKSRNAIGLHPFHEPHRQIGPFHLMRLLSESRRSGPQTSLVPFCMPPASAAWSWPSRLACWRSLAPESAGSSTAAKSLWESVPGYCRANRRPPACDPWSAASCSKAPRESSFQSPAHWPAP